MRVLAYVVLILLNLLLFGAIGWVIWRIAKQKKRWAGESVADKYKHMKRQLTGWGIFFLLSLIVGSWFFGPLVTPGWVLTLLVVAIMFFAYKVPEMFALYGTMLGIKGIINAAVVFVFPSNEPILLPVFLVALVFQLLWAALFYREYFRYSKVAKEYAEKHGRDLTGGVQDVFPTWSLIIGVGSIVILFFSATAQLTRLKAPAYYPNTSISPFALELPMVAATLALGMAVASMLSRFPKKILWILGSISGVSVLVLTPVLIGVTSAQSAREAEERRASQEREEAALALYATQSAAALTPTPTNTPSPLHTRTPDPTLYPLLFENLTFEYSPYFGSAMAIQDDTLVIGGGDYHIEQTSVGAVAIYRRAADGKWVEQGTLVHELPEPGFGRRLHLEGDTLVVGTPLTIYRRQGDTWQMALATDDRAWFMDLSGERVVTTTSDNVITMYARGADGVWGPQWLTSDFCDGKSAMVALDGNTLAIGWEDGASGEVGVCIYSDADGGWKKLQSFSLSLTEMGFNRTGDLILENGFLLLTGTARQVEGEGASPVLIRDTSQNGDWSQFAYENLDGYPKEAERFYGTMQGNQMVIANDRFIEVYAYDGNAWNKTGEYELSIATQNVTIHYFAVQDNLLLIGLPKVGWRDDQPRRGLVRIVTLDE